MPYSEYEVPQTLCRHYNVPSNCPKCPTPSTCAEELSLSVLPTDAKARKGTPLGTGVLDYFPAALAGVARISKIGNDKHNPGEPLHHARGKSMDHWDCMIRHGMERGTVDATTGLDHVLEMAWRALALAQEIMETQYGAPLARGAKLP